MSILGSGSLHMAGRYGMAMPSSKPSAANVTCQKCLQKGHWTYECKNEAIYQARPSRTQQLKNPKYRQRFLDPAELPPELNPTTKTTDQSKDARTSKKKKKKKRSSSGSSSSSSDSDSSSSGSDSDTSNSSSGSDSSSSSGTSSSSSSGSSDSDSDSSSSSSDSGTSSDSSSSGSSDSDSNKGERKKLTKKTPKNRSDGKLQSKSAQREDKRADMVSKHNGQDGQHRKAHRDELRVAGGSRELARSKEQDDYREVEARASRRHDYADRYPVEEPVQRHRDEEMVERPQRETDRHRGYYAAEQEREHYYRESRRDPRDNYDPSNHRSRVEAERDPSTRRSVWDRLENNERGDDKGRAVTRRKDAAVRNGDGRPSPGPPARNERRRRRSGSNDVSSPHKTHKDELQLGKKTRSDAEQGHSDREDSGSEDSAGDGARWAME